MTYTDTCSASDDAIYQALEQERLAISEAYPAYSQQQLDDIWHQRKAQIATRLLDDRFTPRSLRKELGASSSLQARGTAQRGLAVDIPGARKRDLQASNNIAAAPMSRSKGSNSTFSAYLPDMPAPSSSHLEHGINHAGKRSHQESEFAYPASYTYGTAAADWQSNSGLTTQLQQSFEHELNPLEYIQRSLSSDDTQLTAKRQRVVGLNPSALQPYAHNVSQSTSMASSLSPIHITIPSEPMSRQSSVTSASLRDDLSMMRLNSSFSVGSETPFFSFDESEENDALLCNSYLSSAATEIPSSSDPITRQSEYDVMGNDGHLSVGSQQFFLSDCFSSQGTMPMALAAEGSAHLEPAVYSQYAATDMLRTSSEQSSSSSDNSSASSTDIKAVKRLQKHIRNGQRQILSKSSSSGPVSTEYKKDAKPRAIRPQEPGTKRKEPITKQQAYARPQHPKLYCDLCTEYPNGFRGDHELKRHKDRSHTEKRKVWICVDPHISATPGDDWYPQQPLGICKHCKQRKTYNVYYNAAAHLRRAHFFPRKRGRKARGEKPEKRAGKAGGENPPIAWLKERGYLKEIEVGPEVPEEETSIDDEEEDYDDFESVPAAARTGSTQDQSLLLNDADFPRYDFPMEFGGYMVGMAPELDMGLQWAPTAPAMQQTLSAPAAMMLPFNDYGDFYSTDGFDFAVDAAFEH